jgi:acetoin utilization protein AcuC
MWNLGETAQAMEVLVTSRHLAMYAHEELGRYGYDEKAWFRPNVRQEAFLAELTRQGLDARVSFRTAPPANLDDLCLFHTSEYVSMVREQCTRAEGALDHGPTLARPHMERAAAHVAGAVLDATRRIVAGELRTAFVPIAGFHHAHAAQARMYCLYNDPAMALSWLLRRTEGTLAYVDIDIHQGDGVYEGFSAEPRVCIVDIHEDPSTLFPHSPETPGDGVFPGRRQDDGTGEARGTKLNVALSPHTTDEMYLSVWEEAEAFLRRAKPRFIVFVSGVDGLKGDPLSHQQLTISVVSEVTRRVRRVADEFADGRLLVLGGGGYDIDNVSKGWAAVVSALLED